MKEIEINLDDYRCECSGRFKRFGKKNLNQFVCEICGQYVPLEKMYLYKDE